MKKIALIIILLLLPFSAITKDREIPVRTIGDNEYVPLYDIVTVMNLSQTYDPVSRRGKLMYREHQAVYLEDCARMIIDGQLFTAAYPVIRRDEEILIPEELFNGITSAFFDETDFTKEKSAYAIKEQSQKQTGKPPAKKKTPASYAAATAEKIGFVIIDAGHGGKDPGAVGKGKIYEKDITLSVALETGRRIQEKHPDIKVYYTRESDVFIELGGRTELANRKLTQDNGGLFVSIHVNASIVPKMSGYETYFLSQNPTNEEARSTAALENNVVVLENPGRRKSYDDVEYIEALMLTTQIQKESRLLADKIQRSIGAVKGSPSRGVKTADFFVLRGSLMPAALVEIGYITNRNEVKKLITPEYQKKIAGRIAEGVSSFISLYGKRK